MSRIAERHAWKTNPVTSEIGTQSRPAVAEVRAGRQVSVNAGRRQIDAPGAGSSYGVTPERHDWLVPLELP